MSGPGRAEWEGVTVDVELPHPIADLRVQLSAPVEQRLERAAAAVVRAGEQLDGPFDAAARLLVRAEGLASSALEGLRAPLSAVALAEVDDHGVVDAVASWVADDVVVLAEALTDPGPVTSTALRRWHSHLMAHSPTAGETDPGTYRTGPGWVGGADLEVVDRMAAPPETVPGLVEDLMAFVGRDDVDPVAQAAIAHGQFERIQPFVEGNGRLGRVLVARVLADRLGVAVPPPVSLEIVRDVDGYEAGLARYRRDDVEQWVGWFAQAVTGAAGRAVEVLAGVARLESLWHERTAELGEGSVASRVCDVLPAHPVLSEQTVVELLDVEVHDARVALARLADRGVLAEVRGAVVQAEPDTRWWVAHELLGLLGH